MSAKNEFNTQVAVCNWLKVQYPNVIFRSDLGGIRLSIGQARQAKMLQHTRSYPDLFLPEPVESYHGLFIEIKYEDNDLFNKKGDSFIKSEHLFEQASLLCSLNERGYFADFSIGFERTKLLIEDYLRGPSTKPFLCREYVRQLSDWYYGRLPELRLRD